jgi:hypothetical protein
VGRDDFGSSLKVGGVACAVGLDRASLRVRTDADGALFGRVFAGELQAVKRIQANGPEHVLAAIDHADPEVMRGRPLLESTRTPYMGGYDYPQPTTLRTRPSEWGRTVRELMELAPVIVLDLQLPSDHVLREMGWITSGAFAYKTVLVTSDPVADAERFHSVVGNVAECCAQISQLAATRTAIPTPPRDAVPFHSFHADSVVQQRNELRRLYHGLHTEGTDVDAEIKRLFLSVGSIADGSLTASLDRLLQLVAASSRAVSIMIHVDLKGLAACEVGRRFNDAFVVTCSGPRPELSPARALLSTLVAAELRATGEPTHDPTLRASSLRVVRKPRPGRRRLVEQFGSDRLRAQLLNQDAIAAADVLERDLRASPIPGVDVDDRLHALFAVERSPATVTSASRPSGLSRIERG